MSQNQDWYQQVKRAVNLYDSRCKKKKLAPQERREVDAVREALDWIENQPDGDARALIIKMYCIKQTHNMDAASYAAGYSRQHGYNIQRNFMLRVAAILGYVVE